MDELNKIESGEFGKKEISPVELTLSVEPKRAIVDGQVKLTGTAQDYSIGTIQPLFTFEWFFESRFFPDS